MKIKYREAAEVAERSFQTLMGYVTACQQEGVLPAGDTKQLALLTWSIVHSIAKPPSRGGFPFRPKTKFSDSQNMSLGVRCQR